MNKGLEAFNKITSGGCKGKYHEYCEIVENELKDYEKLIITYGAEFINELLKTPNDIKYKKLKALEIIKNKDVDVGAIKHAIAVTINNKATLINAMTKEIIKPYIYYNIPIPKSMWLTEVEFDLLKEVLL